MKNPCVSLKPWNWIFLFGMNAFFENRGRKKCCSTQTSLDLMIWWFDSTIFPKHERFSPWKCWQQTWAATPAFCGTHGFLGARCWTREQLLHSLKNRGCFPRCADAGGARGENLCWWYMDAVIEIVDSFESTGPKSYGKENHWQLVTSGKAHFLCFISIVCLGILCKCTLFIPFPWLLLDLQIDSFASKETRPPNSPANSSPKKGRNFNREIIYLSTIGFSGVT